MPGFKIGGSSKNGPDASPKVDYYRDHRFKLTNFLGMKPSVENGFISVKEIVVPDETYEQLKINTSSAQYNFAKKVTFSDLKLSFYANKMLRKELINLKKKVWTPDTGIGDYGEYKDTVKIIMTDGSGAQVCAFSYKNAAISMLLWGTLSYTSSEIKSVTVSISFDYVESS